MQLKPAARLASATSGTEIVVIRGVDGDVHLTCGGVAMVPAGSNQPASGDGDGGSEDESLTGKRYVDEALGLEVLCTKGGSGVIECDGRLLMLRVAKPLPSTD